MVETPQNYHAGRRTLNHVIARAAREGRIFTGYSGAEDDYRHADEVCNEWELVTVARLRRASEEARDLGHLRGYWLDRSGRSPALNAIPGRNAHGLLWNSGAVLLSILGVIYPRDSLAEMAATIAQYDAGWSHAFRSDLDRSDLYSGCRREMVVTDPIDDVPALWGTSKSTGMRCGNGSAGSVVMTSPQLSHFQRGRLDQRADHARIHRVRFHALRLPPEKVMTTIAADQELVPHQPPCIPALRAADQGGGLIPGVGPL